MDIHLTSFKATTEIKPSTSCAAEPSELRNVLQTICDIIPHDQSLPTFWSMVSYKDQGKHNNQSVDALTGIILEYDKRYEAELLDALARENFPFQYLLVETERKSGTYLSLFFPLAFQPSVSDYMRIAGVLAYQIGVYGLSRGSGTPTFLVKLVGPQTVGEHVGPAINRSYIAETQDIGEGSKTALVDFQGPKPVKPMAVAIDPASDAVGVVLATQGKEDRVKQIAVHFRAIADLFDPE